VRRPAGQDGSRLRPAGLTQEPTSERGDQQMAKKTASKGAKKKGGKKR
jgi:hypothetical protein